MIKNQKIRVNTKQGLIAAFECAKDFPRTTKITLIRKSGETLYEIRPYPVNSYYAQNFSYIYGTQTRINFHKKIKQVQTKIRQTKAIDLLA